MTLVEIVMTKRAANPMVNRVKTFNLEKPETRPVCIRLRSSPDNQPHRVTAPKAGDLFTPFLIYVRRASFYTLNEAKESYKKGPP
jgi:hypothetical protein